MENSKEYIYKKQGDNRDSWLCVEKNINGNVINKYMVYDDPIIHPLIKIFKELTKEQRDQIKTILNKTA